MLTILFYLQKTIRNAYIKKDEAFVTFHLIVSQFFIFVKLLALLHGAIKKTALKTKELYKRLPRFNGDLRHDFFVCVAWVLFLLAEGFVVYMARRRINLSKEHFCNLKVY